MIVMAYSVVCSSLEKNLSYLFSFLWTWFADVTTWVFFRLTSIFLTVQTMCVKKMAFHINIASFFLPKASWLLKLKLSDLADDAQ